MTLFEKLVDQDDRTMSQNNHHVSVWMPASFIEQKGRRERKVKWQLILQNISWLDQHQGGDVLIYSFL